MASSVVGLRFKRDRGVPAATLRALLRRFRPGASASGPASSKGAAAAEEARAKASAKLFDKKRRSIRKSIAAELERERDLSESREASGVTVTSTTAA